MWHGPVDRPVFVRGGIIIPDVRPPFSRGIRAIVNADDGPINAFLGDAENPAHTQWQHDSDKFRGKYRSGKSDLDFVKRSVHEAVKVLAEQNRKPDAALLKDVFNIPVREEPPPKPKPGSPEPDPEPGPKPEPPGPGVSQKRRPMLIDSSPGGFLIRGTGAEGYAPCILRVRVAYHVRTGNPFRKYHPADFDLADGLDTELEGALLVEAYGNRMRIKVEAADFRVKVTGFDPRRDLRIDVRRQEVDDAGQDA